MNAWILMLQKDRKVLKRLSRRDRVKFKFKDSGQECPLHTSGFACRLDAVVHAAEAVFVGFEGFGVSSVGVMFAKVGVVPFLPGGHGVVGSGQRFFGTDGFDPFISG